MSVKKIKTDEYEFSYIDIKYKNNIISPNIELYRWKKIKSIKYKIKNIFDEHAVTPIKGNLANNIENLISRILFESFSANKITKLTDGLFNIRQNSSSLANDLKTTFKIHNEYISGAKCDQIIKEIDLDNSIKIILNELKSMKKEKSPHIKIIKDKTFTVQIHNTTRIDIPADIYTKLKNRYNDYKKSVKKKSIPSCDDLIACLLLRYNSLGSDGNQMGIPIYIKNLFMDCGINFEGFASSLNHHYKYYCSMFYDIEKYFGSLGPFQNITYTRGIYILNPPYEKKLLIAMIDKIITSLSKSSKHLCFVFGTPTWDKYKEITFHDTIGSSEFFKKKYVFGNYEVPWYNFLNGVYTKIPSSTRYILANYYINLNCISGAINQWKTYNPK